MCMYVMNAYTVVGMQGGGGRQLQDIYFCSSKRMKDALIFHEKEQEK